MNTTITGMTDRDQIYEPEVLRYHPGYHSISSSSWWCDCCLSDCQFLEQKNLAGEAHWHDFFAWLAGLLLRGLGAFLSALCAIIVYFMGGLGQPEDLQCKRERQLFALLRHRDSLLKLIDQAWADHARAAFDNQPPYQCDIEKGISMLHEDLSETMVKIEGLEKEVLT